MTDVRILNTCPRPCAPPLDHGYTPDRILWSSFQCFMNIVTAFLASITKLKFVGAEVELPGTEHEALVVQTPTHGSFS